jgi:hypothetical protein
MQPQYHFLSEKYESHIQSPTLPLNWDIIDGDFLLKIMLVTLYQSIKQV